MSGATDRPPNIPMTGSGDMAVNRSVYPPVTQPAGQPPCQPVGQTLGQPAGPSVAGPAGDGPVTRDAVAGVGRAESTADGARMNGRNGGRQDTGAYDRCDPGLARDSSPGHRSRYPIVDRWPLSMAERSGPWGMGGRRRSNAEMLRLRPEDGHHVLVYRVDGDYVEDRGALGPRDDRLVRATHVSVVDKRQNAPVVVQLKIPSKDSRMFSVVVTFGCTVTDAVLVVRQGLVDPQQLLSNYVRSYHGAMRMGLEFTLDEFNDVRRAVDDELTAYHAVTPPVIDGLEIMLSSIEVETPEEVVGVWDELRQASHGHRVEQTKLDYRASNESRRSRIEHDLQAREDSYRRERDQSHNEYRRQSEWLDAQHEVDLTEARDTGERRRREAEIDFRLQQYEKTQRISSSDADRALYHSYLDGKLEASELTSLLRQDRDRRELETRQDVERQHRRAVEAERQQRVDRVQQERYQRDLEEHGRAARDAERQRAWQLEDEERRAVREDQQRAFEAKLQLLKGIAERGGIDMVNVNLDGVINNLLGAGSPPTQLPGGQESPGITDSAPAGTADSTTVPDQRQDGPTGAEGRAGHGE
jgi:hypothetical protein